MVFGRVAEAVTALLILMFGMVIWAAVSRRRVRQHLVLARKQHIDLARVLDGVNAGLLRVRMAPDGAVVRMFVNSGTARILRLPTAVCDPDFEILALAEPPMALEAMAEVRAELHGAGFSSFELRLRCGDGEVRWMRFAIRVIQRDGDALELVGLVTDIEVERASVAAATSAARLATLGVISAGIAHEISQPLAVIALCAATTESVLEEDPVKGAPLALQQQIKIIEMTGRARAITDHLRLFASNYVAELRPTDLAIVVKGATMLTAAAVRNARIVMESNEPAEMPLVVGQQVLLEQVLMNLILNARDAMLEVPPPQRRLRITAAIDTGTVRLMVADNGSGIPPSALPRLFEPFFTTKPAGLGTGLGLSICHGILAACGGTISAANDPNGGAAFTVTLKRAMPGHTDPVDEKSGI